MAIQGSGTISMQDLINEFGGSGAVSLSDYYRGGGLVPDIAQNSGVPTSGAIKLSDFYGAQDFVPDVIPDAVNWTNVLGTAGAINVTNEQTISGINTDITLRCSDTGGASIFYSINGAGGDDAESNFTVSNGVGLSFVISNPTATSGTVTVLNVSDGNATLDTFTYTLEEGGGL